MLFLFFSTNLFIPLHAGTCTWTGDAGTGLWSDTGNWSPSGIPQTTDNVIINSGTITLDVPVTVSTLTLRGGTLNGSQNLTISSVLTWKGGTISGSGFLYAQGTLTLDSTTNKTLTTRTLEFSGSSGSWSGGNLVLSSNTTFRVMSGASFTLNHPSTQTLGSASTGTFEIAGTLTKQQSSITNVSGAFNVNGGILNVDAGTLNMSTSSSGAHSGTVNIASGAVLSYTAGTHNYNSGASVNGTGTFRVTGATGVNFNTGSSLNTMSNAINSGTLNANADIAVSTITQRGGSFSGTGSPTITNYYWKGGSITGSGMATVSTNLTIDSTLSKTLTTRTLSIASTGTWSDGTISISAATTFQIQPAATFYIEHASARDFGSATTGVIDIQGTVTKRTNASTTTVKGNFNTNGGNLNIETGTIRTGSPSSGAHTGAIEISGGAIFEFFSGTHNFDSGSTVTGAGTFRVAGAIVNMIAGSFLETIVTVTSGTCSDNQGITPLAYTQSGGTFIANTGTYCLGDMAWSGGTISGLGSFTVDGTSTYTGTARNLTAAMLVLNGDGNWNTGNFVFATAAILHLNATKTLNLNHSGAADYAITGVGTVENEGTIRQALSGYATTFAADYSNAGSTEGLGSLVFNGILDHSGTFSPGLSPGILTVSKYDNTNGSLEIEIESTAGDGIGHDRLTVTNDATLGGTLNVYLLNGFVPAVGNSFTILTGASVSGTFSTANLPSLPTDRFWVTDYYPTSVVLSVASALPIQLVDFQAFAKQENIILEWETASEQNNRGFEIQRNLNGQAWEIVGFVNGAGNSSEAKTYLFTDAPRATGNIYYRLRQMDFDGKEEFSPVRNVELESFIGDWSAYPNPLVGKQLTLENTNAPDGIIKWQIFSIAGALIQEGTFAATLSNKNYHIQLNQSLTGIYNLVLRHGNHSKTIRLIGK